MIENWNVKHWVCLQQGRNKGWQGKFMSQQWLILHEGLWDPSFQDEGAVLPSLHGTAALTAPGWEQITRKADWGSCSALWRAKWLFKFCQDSSKTQILQPVVNKAIKSHHQIIMYGSRNDFLLFPIDIFPLKGGQALLSNTDTPSAFTTTWMEVPWHLCCQQNYLSSNVHSGKETGSGFCSCQELHVTGR